MSAPWEALLGLPIAEVARRGLAGDALARAVAHMPLTARWFEVTGDPDDPPLDVMLADLRARRRRAIIRGRR